MQLRTRERETIKTKRSWPNHAAKTNTATRADSLVDT
jgi:hypothetical protein